MRKNKYIVLYVAAVLLTFAMFSATSAVADYPLSACSEYGCDNQNPYNISDLEGFLKNESCSFFKPGGQIDDIEDVAELVSDYVAAFGGKTMRITAIAREAGHRITVAPGDHPDDILFDSDNCYNWGLWVEFNFAADDLLFTDRSAASGNEWAFPNGAYLLPFKVYRLKQGTYSLNYLANPVELKPGDYVFAINDLGSDSDFDDFILVAREKFFTFSVPTGVPIRTKDGYGFLTNCITESGYCEVTHCAKPGSPWRSCDRKPIEEFLQTTKGKATLLEVPGKRGGVIINDTSNNSPSYCSGGWCWYPNY